MTRFVHLPPTGADPHRWINPEAVEWFAAAGVESVVRMRTGDTLRTSLSVTELGDQLAEAHARLVTFGKHRMYEHHFEPHDQIEHPPGL